MLSNNLKILNLKKDSNKNNDMPFYVNQIYLNITHTCMYTQLYTHSHVYYTYKLHTDISTA